MLKLTKNTKLILISVIVLIIILGISAYFFITYYIEPYQTKQRFADTQSSSSTTQLQPTPTPTPTQPKPTPPPTPTPTQPKPTPTPTQPKPTPTPTPTPTQPINALEACASNTTQYDCDKSGTCYYTNNGCYSKSIFSRVPQININNNLTCAITPYNENNYILSCNNITLGNTQNYLFNNLSTDKNCPPDKECNLIRQITDKKQPYTLTFINNTINDVAILDEVVVNKITNNFTTDDFTGILYASDENKSNGKYATMPVPYTVEKYKPLSIYQGINSSDAVDSSVKLSASNLLFETNVNLQKINIIPTI